MLYGSAAGKVSVGYVHIYIVGAGEEKTLVLDASSPIARLFY